MVLIAGWGDKGRIIGRAEEFECKNCNNINPFNVVEQSRRVTAFFIPIIKWDYRYYLLCPICSRGAQLKNKQAAIKIIGGALRSE